jgi:hypothetical protein|tara:strand:- start:938 stop:1390 length:453 start_codon:yes stop_codon:yes gene_type:complete
MPKIIDGDKQILTSGYGTGLTSKQKLSRAWVLKPTVYSTETVIAGNGTSNATVLSSTTTVSLVQTKANATHVTLGKGVEGQLKVIIHKSILGGNALVITPEDGIGGSSIFAAGDTLTSNLAARAVQLLFDGLKWQVVAGEITGTAEMVIA